MSIPVTQPLILCINVCKQTGIILFKCKISIFTNIWRLTGLDKMFNTWQLCYTVYTVQYTLCQGWEGALGAALSDWGHLTHIKLLYHVSS